MILTKVKKMVKKILFTLFKSKWFLYNAIYSFLHGKKILCSLQSDGFEHIEEYEKKAWTATPFVKRYYKAVFNKKKCFIKVGNYNGVLEREVSILNRIKTNSLFLKDCVPDLIKSNAETHYPYIATSFINDVVNWNDLDDSAKKVFFQNIEQCLDEMYNLSIIHMDLNYGNILVKSNGDIILLDFGASYCASMLESDEIYSKSELPKSMNLLGGWSKPSCGLFDDAYSVLVLIKQAWPEFKVQYPSEWLKINKIIGRFQYKFNKFSKNYFEGA